MCCKCQKVGIFVGGELVGYLHPANCVEMPCEFIHDL